MRTLVLDTNIVLDLFVFADERLRHVHAALEAGEVQWLGTASMRDELERVLSYPHIAAQMAIRSVRGCDVLARFDARVSLCDIAQPSSVRCTDEDDQKFIDLAVAHNAALLSKDNAVLSLKKRLALLGVGVSPH